MMSLSDAHSALRQARSGWCDKCRENGVTPASPIHSSIALLESNLFSVFRSSAFMRWPRREDVTGCKACKRITRICAPPKSGLQGMQPALTRWTRRGPMTCTPCAHQSMPSVVASKPASCKAAELAEAARTLGPHSPRPGAQEVLQQNPRVRQLLRPS